MDSYMTIILVKLCGTSASEGCPPISLAKDIQCQSGHTCQGIYTFSIPTFPLNGNFILMFS